MVVHASSPSLGRWSFEVRTLPYHPSGPALPAASFASQIPNSAFFVCRLVERSVLCNAPHDLLGALHRLVQMFDG